MRIVLVDYMHLAHKCVVVPPMDATIKVNGEVKRVTTTIPSVTIKSIFGYSNKGNDHIGVFFEGSNLIRTEYFKKYGINYKGQRRGLMPTMREGVNWTKRLLRDGEVSLYCEEGYEADDLIYSKVLDIKEKYPNAQIDIITCDSDLLSLVDDNVTVYIKANRTYADEGCKVIKNYFQVTKNSWEDYFWYSSTYKNFKMPYNSLLLYKMIKGDKSDNIPMSLKGFGAKKYNDLIDKLTEDNVDFENVFRYGKDFNTEITPVLKKYFSNEDLNKLKMNYDGVNLLYKEGLENVTQIQVGKLVPSVLRLGIQLKV